MPLIRTTGPFPPGGWPYADPRSGMRFPGMEQTFEEQVSKIIRHRLGNYGAGKLYDPAKGDEKHISTEEVTYELHEYTCQRLGYDPKFCYPKDHSQQVVLRDKFFETPNNRTCPKCNNALKDKLCPTCQGNRVIGVECPVCGWSVLK